MIYLNIHIKNPFAEDKFKFLFCKNKKLTKHKHVEIELTKYNPNILGLLINFAPIGKDHGGLEIEVCFLGYILKFEIHDCRHWDYKLKKWYGA